MKLDHQLSFQLYSARSFPPVETQLRELAELGFTNVEPYGDLYADLEGFKRALDANNLKTVSGHFDLAAMENTPEDVLAVAKTLGMSVVVAPWLEEDDRPSDAAGWKALGHRLAVLAERFAAHGLTMAWHNHDFEFVKLADGTSPIEHLLEGNNVALELDVAWMVRAGVDPLPWIARYAERLVAMHVKDVAPAGENLDQDGWTNVGEGVVDWPAIWRQLSKTKVRVAILEHDEPKDWAAFAERSAATVKRLIGAAE